MIEQINNFIQKRFSKDCDWINGNCLWFAYILKKRFEKLNIYYLPIEGHFVVGYLSSFFDWTGEIKLKETPILFDEIKEIDPLWYNRLLSDCLY